MDRGAEPDGRRCWAAFNSAVIGAGLVELDDLGAHWREANPALCELLGYSPQELCSATVQQTTYPGDHGIESEYLRGMQAGQIRSYEVEKRCLRKSKEPVWVLASGSLLPSSHQRPITLVYQLQDISERKRLEGELRERATRDELTGLHNRPEMLQYLEEELARCERHKRFASFLAMDLDKFTAVNDTYGHHVGDDLLRQMAQRVRDDMRAFDHPARYGGDELAVVLPETTSAGAFNVAERIRSSVSAQPFAVALHNGSPFDIGMTVSLGIACFPVDALTTANLIARADQALYRAKALGGNRTIVFGMEVRSRGTHLLIEYD